MFGFLDVTSLIPAVAITDLNKSYDLVDGKVEVLKNVVMKVSSGEFVCICGRSGSGKTTLLNLISGLDTPDSGNLAILGEELTGRDENFLSDFRCNKVGFVFQSFNLLPTLTVAENIAFPMEWRRVTTKHIEEKVIKLLETVDMLHRVNHFPSQLSGGEQQRVAFARALANDPPLLLADEPTGNLDENNCERIFNVLKLLKSNGKTIVASTHDAQIKELADRIFYLQNGQLRPNNV